MSTSTERVRILKCPLCGDAHTYALAIERAMISGLATQPQFSRKATFNEPLPCPAKDEDFQAVIRLVESGMSPIVSVRLIEIIRDGSD